MIRAAGLLLAGVALTGCGPYVLGGRVVEGAASRIEWVGADDPRLGSRGVEGATYQLTMDPGSLGRKVVARGVVGTGGELDIPVREFGAGVLEYDFELLVRRGGYDSAVAVFRLPGRDRKVLATLVRGPDRYHPPDDPLGGAERYLNDR